MKNKLLAGLTACMLAFSLVGCGETTTLFRSEENKEEASENAFGKNTFVHIGDELYYDPTTRIVYMKHDNVYGYSYSAYYAPNGLPYKYNPETHAFEEIERN